MEKWNVDTDRSLSQELAAAATLRVVGGPNYAQFGNRVHVGRAHVRSEADHADGMDDLLMGDSQLERRDEPGGAASRAYTTARAETGGRGAGCGKASGGEDEKQSPVRPNAVVKIFGNSVKIAWNEGNREDAICTCMK